MAWTGTVPSFAAGERVRASKLQTLADIATELTATWSTWPPTLSALTQGSGTLLARYRQLGKTVDFVFEFVYGSGSAVGTNPTFSLPATPASLYTSSTDLQEFCHGSILDSGTTVRPASGVLLAGTANVAVFYWNATPATTQITSSAPWTWANGDRIFLSGSYLAA